MKQTSGICLGCAAALLVMSAPVLPSFPPVIDLSDLDGSNGFVIEEECLSMSDAGDVNDDGIDDVIIGCPSLTPAGQSYVVFGRTDGFPAALNLSDLDGSNGFVINGIDEGDGFGLSVSGAGDLNDDGTDDVIIGSADRDFTGGDGYVVFGRHNGFPAALNVSDLDGSNGFVIIRIDFANVANVSDAGDVNDDGIDDVIVSNPDASPNGIEQAGQSYVVFGRTDGFPAALNLSDLDGSNGFVINGIDEIDFSGGSVSAAGDVNDDGIGDVVIGAADADPNNVSGAGESYVVFGRNNGFPAVLNLSDLDGSNGFVLNGIEELDRAGNSVSNAGDVNDDGIDDIVIGTIIVQSQNRPGKCFVVFGHKGAFPSAFNLSDLDGSNGFVLNGVENRDFSGNSVSAAGDVNDDGIDDVIIGAPGAAPSGTSEAGKSYVVFGGTGGFPATINLADLDGSNGFVINGIDENDNFGSSVSGAGDVNDDGIDDIIIITDPGRAGQSYVVFGRGEAIPVNIDIAPFNKRNTMNPRSRGGLWVALLSDIGAPFDPSSQVDIPTVEFGPDNAKVARYKVKDINKDGLGDLLLRFNIPETGIACGDTEATLTGKIFDGRSFAGTDSIKTVGCKKPKNLKTAKAKKH